MCQGSSSLRTYSIFPYLWRLSCRSGYLTLSTHWNAKGRPDVRLRKRPRWRTCSTRWSTLLTSRATGQCPMPPSENPRGVVATLPSHFHKIQSPVQRTSTAGRLAPHQTETAAELPGQNCGTKTRPRKHNHAQSALPVSDALDPAS